MNFEILTGSNFKNVHTTIFTITQNKQITV